MGNVNVFGFGLLLQSAFVGFDSVISLMRFNQFIKIAGFKPIQINLSEKLLIVNCKLLITDSFSLFISTLSLPSQVSQNTP